MAYALDRKHRAQIATASGLDVLAGLWILISPWVVGFQMVNSALTNNVLFGIAITVLAAIRFFGAFDLAALSWINALLGVWVLISPWALGFDYSHAPMINNVIMGIVVIVLAICSALATVDGRSNEM